MDQASEQHHRRAVGCPREAEFSAMAKASGASSSPSVSGSVYPLIDFSRVEVGIQAPAAPAPVEQRHKSPSPPPLISVEQPVAPPAFSRAWCRRR